VSFFYSPVYQPSPDDYAQYRGYLYEPTGLTPHRFGNFVDEYAAAGYFPPGAKVGILLADDGSGSNQYLVNQLWRPQLAARGINPVVFTYPLVQNVSDNSSIASEFSSAVLQFKAAGVDHVMVTPDNGDATIFFTQVAESQGYRPRYALNSADAPAAWSGVPQGQRANALNISFQLQDLGGTPDPGEIATNPASAARSHCEAVFRGHTGASPITSAYAACDSFDLMEAGLKGAASVTPDSLLTGVDRVRSLVVANGYGDALFGPPNRYDGAATTRMMVWDEGAKKWHYTAPPRPVP
jgi:ABC-type branched-subunit amino acid transport system substrate-binding protein